MKAVWSGTILAESYDTLVVESGHYFPQHAVAMECMTPVTPRQSVSENAK